MGVMTGQTLPLPDRLVHYALFERSGLILVTPIAEVGSGLLEQPFETCHVWTVTRTASALGNRLMHCFALEVSLLVALKAGNLSKTGGSLTHTKDNYQ